MLAESDLAYFSISIFAYAWILKASHFPCVYWGFPEVYFATRSKPPMGIRDIPIKRYGNFRGGNSCQIG